jgi:3-oxoacyl-[acyl-carrier protein] reductase
MPPETNRASSPVILVTGAAGGIGSAICATFAKAGKTVVACDQSEAGLQALMSSLSTLSGRCFTKTFDITNPSACIEAFSWLRDTVGRLDALVNNAGAWFYEEFCEATDEHWHQVFAVNVLTPARLCRLAVPLLEASPCPRIVNIGSKSGLQGQRCLSSYCVSKSAIEALTRCLALELGSRGILVNCVAPGVIDTDSNANLKDSRARNAAEDRIPLGRLGTAFEVAKAVAYFCSEECSFSTGSTLLIDGGQLSGESPGPDTVNSWKASRQ